jgi:hypothetical protein
MKPLETVLEQEPEQPLGLGHELGQGLGQELEKQQALEQEEEKLPGRAMTASQEVCL